VSEVVALVCLSTTIFLFIHTRELSLRLAVAQQTAPSGPELEDIMSSGRPRSPSRELSTAQERSHYGKVSGYWRPNIEYKVAEMSVKTKVLWISHTGWIRKSLRKVCLRLYHVLA
jgi:hypothetical protein